MNTYPDLQTIKQYAETGTYRTIPVSIEMYSDMYTPIGVLRVLKKVSDHCYMFESAEDAKQWGRYSFLGFEPTMEISCRNGKIQIKNGAVTEAQTNHPGKYIREVIEKHKAPQIEGLPTFTGGLVGYFSYDYIKYVEPTLNLDAQDDAHFRDMDLMLFDQVIAFDHLQQKIILIVNMPLTEEDGNVKFKEALKMAYEEAKQRLVKIKELIEACDYAPHVPLKLKSEFTPRFSKEKYCEMVEKAKHYIYEGDIFQVVLANRLKAKIEGSILEVYRVLRTTNPSPYMFYFSSNDIEIAGASPETLAKLEGGMLHTFPLAGTRKRGNTYEEDQALEKELLADEKELAEHNMLVDLGRNDIGKISRIGTVEVEKYMQIERFSHVMHIGSTVKGQIREDKDFVDTIDAILPAGTLSGAPKIRACEIINELEDCKRGIYGGAVGYIDFTGNVDTCIAIRMAYAKENVVYVCSGAGIVADSIPENEYQECINKAKAVTKAIEQAGKGMEA